MTEKTLKIASTNRHWDSMKHLVDGYFLDSLIDGDNSFQKAYDVVTSWFFAGDFTGYDAVELYVTSKPVINAGLIEALDDCGIEVRIMEHCGGVRYRHVKRDRWAKCLRVKD